MCRVKDEAGVVYDRSNGQPKGVINRSHPLHVASRQIVVHGYQMRATTEQGVEIQWQGGNQRLSFARFHLSDAALMEDNTAKELAIEMTHAGYPTRDFADCGVGFGKDVVKHVGFSGMEFSFQCRLFLLEVVPPLQHVSVRSAFPSNLGRLV